MTIVAVQFGRISVGHLLTQTLINLRLNGRKVKQFQNVGVA